MYYTQDNSHDSRAWPVRVYYEDTDAGGIVYYANYLKFCERARTEWLRVRGISQQALLEKQRLAFVVIQVTAQYHAPARLDDRLQIISAPSLKGRTRIIFVQKIMRDAELLFESDITLACIHLDKGKATALPETIRSLLI